MNGGGAHAAAATNRQVFLGLLAVLTLLVTMALLFGFSFKAGADPGNTLPPIANAKIKGVDPEAAGINEGDKKQGSAIKMKDVPKIDNDAVAGKSGKFGGCTEGYGKGKLCLPPVSVEAYNMGMNMKEMPWTCTQVRNLFVDGIPLNKIGTDPLQLDTNNDGVGCGKGD